MYFNKEPNAMELQRHIFCCNTLVHFQLTLNDMFSTYPIGILFSYEVKRIIWPLFPISEKVFPPLFYTSIPILTRFIHLKIQTLPSLLFPYADAAQAPPGERLAEEGAGGRAGGAAPGQGARADGEGGAGHGQGGRGTAAGAEGPGRGGEPPSQSGEGAAGEQSVPAAGAMRTPGSESQVRLLLLPLPGSPAELCCG